jgi:ankyrin repeat protein
MLLLEKGPYVDYQDNDGETPLFNAARFSPGASVARVLVADGADVNVQDQYKNTPLELAAAAGNLQLVEFLLGQGAESKNALHAAAGSKNPDTVELLLEHNRSTINTRDSYGMTPRCYAAENPNPEATRILLAAGAKINRWSSRSHRTPLHIAAKAGNHYTVEALMEKKPKLDVRDNEGQTPLDIAVDIRTEVLLQS